MIYFYLIQMKNLLYYDYWAAYYAWNDKVEMDANEHTIEMIKVESTHEQNEFNEKDEDKHFITITHLNYYGIKTNFK